MSLEAILKFLEQSSAVINLVAVGVIVGGFILAAVRYTRKYRKWTKDQNFHNFKVELGRALTLGLEILVLADVIETITVVPTFQSLTFLAFLVIIRTIVSWTLILETEGRWPWQPEIETTKEESNG